MVIGFFCQSLCMNFILPNFNHAGLFYVFNFDTEHFTKILCFGLEKMGLPPKFARSADLWRGV